MTLTKQRARAPEEKAERRQDLLNAARRLFVKNGYQLPSAEAVAAKAGVSKATVWVYFRTKEEMYLALYDEDLRALLVAMSTAAREGDRACAAERVKATIRDFFRRRPEFLALGALINSVVERNVSVEFVREHKRRIGAALLQTASDLVAVFPGSNPRDLFLRSYAFALGLWQLAEPAPVIRRLLNNDPELSLFRVDFHAELAAGLDLIWQDVTQSVRKTVPRGDGS